MKLVELNWRPSDRQLRQFGLTALVALPVLAWFWGVSASTFWILAGCGVACAAIGYVLPQTLRPLFLGVSLITLPIGIVVGELAMLILFFGVFLPMALVFKLMGRDALLLRPRPHLTSYWLKKAPARNVASYYRQW